MKRADETLDTFYHGQILVLQKKKGYRFAVDAPILADFIQTKESDKLLEIGAGCGIISLLLSIKPFTHITALEIQETLIDLAKRNVALNRLEDRITIIQGDIREFSSPHKFDIIFSNPPYIRKQTGHLSASEEKSIAKHELKSDILSVMQAVSRLLKKEGKACFIFSENRKLDFFDAAGKSGLKIKSIRFIYPRLGGAPSLFLAECDFSAEKEIHMSPLILYGNKNKYTPEAEEIFSGRIKTH